MNLLEPPRHPLLAGRYELLDEIGRGSMGVVHRVFDRESRRSLALKALYGSDPDDLYRLKSEFRALAGLLHPHLIRLYEMIVEGDHAFFTMELLEGARTLVDFLRSPSASDHDVRDCFRQLAGGLSALHDAGWIHRDIKPSNVLVDAGGRVVLLDFGLIRAFGSELIERTQVGAIVGTLAYMSPEQALGRPLTAASDWYSFGVLLYECLTGRSPFAGAPAEALLDRARFSIPPPSQVAAGVPPDLDALASALLAADPVQRPGAAAVQAVLSGDTAEEIRASVRSVPFVGRAQELAALQRAWVSLRPGTNAVATLEGSSGLGKSALLDRFTAELPARGALVLRARCHPHELVPFEALDEVVDDLSRYLSSLSPERLDALLPRDATALRKLFPVLGRLSHLPATASDGAMDAEPHELRRRGFGALRELLGRIADRRPLVVCIDDLQWADADSGPLLREMLREPDPPPILWLLSYRSEDLDRSPLLQDLEKLLEAVPEARRTRIVLAPLGPEESEELAALLVESPLAPREVAELAREAGGSPFLLGELLRRDGEIRDGTEPAPDLDVLIRRRLAGLPVEAQRLLEALSVAAGPVDRIVALDAAGLGSPDPNLGVMLESARLMRTTPSDGPSRLEIYHDRIRESIERQLPTERRTTRHREIAEALERRGSLDVASLFLHHAGAGNRSAAARYAFRAGEQAAEQLAFDQAARFYRSALDQDRSVLDAVRTLERVADALANAGRGPQAAEAFEEAADAATEKVAETLRQRAAEQYLVCGRLEDGKRVLAPLLAHYGVRYPATSAGALAGALLRLPGLAWRYFGPTARDRRRSEALALRIDACHRAARGLMMVDPPRAAFFAVHSLVDALRYGDGFRTGRALCAVGGALAPFDGPAGAWAGSMLARAETLASEVCDPRLDGMLAIARAQAEFKAGRFVEMLALCDSGAKILVDRCRGVRWDCDVAQMGALRALEELGRVNELRARLATLIDEAVSLDDLYAEVTFCLFEAFWRIAQGEPDEARHEARDVLARWGGTGFQLQHLYELRIHSCCDVYEGRPEEGWRRIEDAWPSLERSGLLAHGMLRSDAAQLRARVALAAADANPAGAHREAERAARLLERMKRPDATASAAMLRAALLARQGDRNAAMSCLLQAETSYEEARMSLHVAYARRRRGALLGGEDGDALVWSADRALEAAGIRAPERWLELHAPGFAAPAV